MQKEKPKPAGPSKADRFWSIFLFTKDGKIKNPLIIYSFSLSFVLLAVYGMAYYFLIDPVHFAFDTSPLWLANIMESLLPGLAGCALVCLLQATAKGKSYIPVAYLWLAVYALLILAWMMASLDTGDDRAFFLGLFLRLVPVPLLIGGGASWLFYRKSTGDGKGKNLPPPKESPPA